MIASFCWSMISGQTLRVCPEGKPVPTPHQVRGRLFRIMLVRPPGLLSSGSSTGKSRLRRLFCFDCAPDHISVASADLFILYRTSPQSGPFKAVQRSTPLGRLCFFDRGRSPTAHPLSLVGSHWLKPGRFSLSRRWLAPAPSWTLIRDSHAGRGSIGLVRGYSARHGFDRSCGNSICSNDVQPRTLIRLRQWTCGVWGWRCAGGRIGPGVAFRCRFGCPRRRSGWCRLRR